MTHEGTSNGGIKKRRRKPQKGLKYHKPTLEVSEAPNQKHGRKEEGTARLKKSG